MTKKRFIFWLLLGLFIPTGQVHAVLPGSCDGTTTPTLFICVPPQGQELWHAEWLDFANKVDAHVAGTIVHGATSTNTPNTIILRNSSGGFSAGVISGSLSGNASTATAFAANPTDCPANQFATGIAANGNLTCTTSSGGTAGVADPGANGMVARTSMGVSAARTITGTTGNILVTSGNGSGNPVIDLGVTAVQTDQANSWTTGNQDFGAATALKVPIAAGASPATTGTIAYDSTSETFEVGVNGLNRILALTNGNIATATALAANGANCSGNNFALGVDASGVGECAQPAFSNLSGSATDAQIPDTITASNYLPLAAGSGSPLTAQLYLDNLGLEFEESDTNPTCASGRFSVYADLSELKIKKCEDGVASDIGATAGASGDISDVWSCSTGDCSDLTAASGDSLDAGAASMIRPETRSTSLPASCSEGQLHQDTDSGGTELYICTAVDTWTKLIAATDNIATATALAANPTDCAVNQFATAIAANGNLTCATVASIGGAVVDPGSNGIVVRDSSSSSVARTLTGTSGNITVTNGSGVSGNPTIDLAATAVQTDQANTYTTGAQSFAAATSLTMPVAAGAAPATNGFLAYDSTSHTVEVGVNGVNRTIATTISNVATATALAANGSNCSAGNFPLGVDASGASESCTDSATQVELDAHASLTSAHSSTSANTASRIVERDASGNFAAGTITATLTGNASTATALAANGANCAANNFALGVSASGVAECAQPAFTDISGSVTDAQVPDTITASLYLPLAGGTLTGQLITDNLGIELEESDTNPTCGAGNFSIYADLSELKVKKCEDGVASDIGATAGASGDITDVWNCATGDCQTLTASAGDSLNATSAASMIPQPLSTTLPGTCTEGMHYQDTDSGGSETYVCTAANTWTKLIGAADNIATATALAANGANCSAGNFPLGVDATGVVESCTDAATQAELDTHAALTTAHSSTSANTASRIVQRDGSGNFSAGTITAALTGNSSTTTALAANGANCSAGNFPLGVDTLGAVESCTDAATQVELDTHAALTNPHSATALNTASRIVLRDGSGNFAAGTITAALTGNASTATALVSNGANCSAGNFPLGVDTGGGVESCTDAATQTELDAHAALTSTHGATTANTASRIVLRDGLGGTLWESSVYDVASLPTCNTNAAYTYATIDDGIDASDCTTGGGGTTGTLCKCDGSAWVPAIASASSGTLQQAYDNGSMITMGASGLKISEAESIAKSFQICGPGDVQCAYFGVDATNEYFQTFKNPTDQFTKTYSTKSWGIKNSSDTAMLNITDAGVVSGTLRFVRVLDSNTTNVALASSTTETALYSVTIPGGTLGTSSCVRVSLDGQGFNQTGSAQNFSSRIKYGTNFGTSVANAQNDSATNRYSQFVGKVCGNGTTSSQVISFNWTLAGTTSASYGTIATDSTTDQTLIVYLTLGANSASMTWTHDYAISEILP